MYKIESKEQFRKDLESIIIPESSIGLHGIDKIDSEKIYHSIANQGLRMSSKYGLVGNIEFRGDFEHMDINDIYDYGYGNKIVLLAIPKIGEFEDVQFYIGSFPKNRGGYQKDDYRCDSIPIHNLKFGSYLPKEFVVGVFMHDKNDAYFELNPNYLGLKDNKEPFYRQLFDSFDGKMLVFNEKNAKKAERIINMYGNLDADGTYYIKGFLNEYEGCKKDRGTK